MRPYLVTWLEQIFPSHVAAAIAPSWFTCVGLAGLVALLLMLVVARRHERRELGELRASSIRRSGSGTGTATGESIDRATIANASSIRRSGTGTGTGTGTGESIDRTVVASASSIRRSGTGTGTSTGTGESIDRATVASASSIRRSGPDTGAGTGESIDRATVASASSIRRSGTGTGGGIDRTMVASAVLWCYVAAVAAGILVPMCIELVAHLVSTGQVRFRWAGMTSFWGYLAGLVAVAVVCHRHAVPLARFGDLAAAPLGVALVFARLGCFLGGCDYGKVTSVPWAVRFPSGSPAWRDHVRQGLLPSGRGESLPVHPTQLYEALLGLAIVGIAIWIARSSWARARHGRIFLAAAVTYAIGRIAIERLRGDLGRGIYAGLSSGQIFSLFVLVAIAGGAILLRRRARRAIATAAARGAAVTAGALVLAVIAWARPAAAQPQPQPPIYGPAPPPPRPQPAQPQPQPYPPPAPYPPPGQPAPYPGTGQPPAPYPPPGQPAPYPGTGQPVPPPYPQPQPVPAHPQQPSAPPRDLPDITIGMLYGAGIPLNRRPEQVRTLSGPTISIGYEHANFGFWLDFDSFGNTDASHGTLLISTGRTFAVSPVLALGARVGIGPTLVNFDEPAFRDVVGTSLRIEATAEFAISRSWVLWARPFSIDTLIADDLGGPITTWQVRAGLAYAIGGARRTPRAAAPVTTASKP